MPIEESGHPGISRRKLLQAGAVVGGTIWAAPVIESFTSRAYAAGSESNFCCSCSNPLDPANTPNPNVGEADGSPPSVQDCVAFCSGQDVTPPPGQPFKYQSFTWCPGGPNKLSYSSSGFLACGPGCYESNAQPVPSGCTTGTIQYSAGNESGFTVTNPNSSGATCD